MKTEEMQENRKADGKVGAIRTVRAETPAYGGYAIGRDERIVFIKGAIPGELVEVTIEDVRKDYYTATVREVIEPSPFRREAPCPVFGMCGGCQLQFASYERQVSMKEEILVDALRRIGGIEVPLLPSISGDEFGYRLRAQFKVSSQGAMGFYAAGTRDIVPIRSCPLMVDEVNRILHVLLASDTGGARELHVSAGDTSVVLVKGGLYDETAQGLLEKGVSGIAFENGDSIGKDYITLDLQGLKYTVTPWSFFQSNWSLNKAVVEIVTNELCGAADKRVLDLYSGAGNLSLPVSLCAREVVSVEENHYAVEDGRRNVALNGIKNCSFINMSVEEFLGKKKKQKAAKFLVEGHFEIVMLDPPRTGLTSEGVRAVLEMNSDDIVYMSCNPATLSRDLKKMNERYEIRSIRMIDFFPNTYHIEALAFLNKK